MLTRSFLSAALAFLLPASAHAARAVMENIAASNNTVFVDTQTKRVHLSTQAYGDGVPTVSLYTTSNVVVGNDNAIVLYATGSVKVDSIAFADGTTQDTASSANKPSSYTFVSDGSHDAGTHGTTYSVAYATVSFTANNVDLKVCVNICFRTNGTGAMGGWSILVNGVFPTGTNLTSTRGVKAIQIDTTNQCIDASSCYRFPAQGSGTKNFALVIAAPNGSIVSWDDDNAAGNMDTQFEVFEP